MFALEVNLRKGGTTHPFVVLRNLVPGRYDADAGQWVAADGTARWYWSTDNLVDRGWLGLPPATVIKAVADAGLQFDYRTGTGVVLHMLSCLAIDGRFGLTAIGRTAAQAAAFTTPPSPPWTVTPTNLRAVRGSDHGRNHCIEVITA